MNCVNCGAALAPDSAVCPFCRTRNDVDLRGLLDVAQRRPDESRRCPHCADLLETLDFGAGGSFLIERCPLCLGLFFDPGELETLVAEHGGRAPRINVARLDNLLAQETPGDFSQVRYLKCPTCGERMNRRSWGKRAGVIVDECRAHGVWLDGGELRRILVWTRAGGVQHDARRELEEHKHQQDLERLSRPLPSSEERERVRSGLDFVSVVVDLVRLWLRNTI